HDRYAVRQLPHPRERVAHERPVRQLELQRAGPGSLAQSSEEADAHVHAQRLVVRRSAHVWLVAVDYASRMPTRRSWLAVPLAVCVAAVLGCGTSGKHASLRSSRASTALTADPSVAALVPAPIKARGTIMVASDASYAPDEFIAPDGHSVIGMDADLVQALGVVMGLKVKIVNST